MIRLATDSDIPQMVAWGRDLFERSGWPEDVTCDDGSMAETLRLMMGNPDMGVLVHAHGFAGLQLFRAYFNHALLFAKKVWWYVEPNRPAARRELMRGMEEWARGRGASRLITSAAAGLNPRAIGEIYRRAGYVPSEYQFMKRL